MQFELMNFITVIVLAFAIVMVMAGLFTAYFGSGKSRLSGIIMLIVGVAVGVVWVFLCNGFGSDPIIENVAVLDVFLDALIDLIGVLIGAIVAVIIFLVAILKS